MTIYGIISVRRTRGRWRSQLKNCGVSGNLWGLGRRTNKLHSWPMGPECLACPT